MIVELILTDGRPLRLPANLVTVRHDNGTPLLAASAYGGGSELLLGSVAHQTPAEFERVLRQLGIRSTELVVQSLAASAPPAGARILHSPG